MTHSCDCLTALKGIRCTMYKTKQMYDIILYYSILFYLIQYVDCEVCSGHFTAAGSSAENEKCRLNVPQSKSSAEPIHSAMTTGHAPFLWGCGVRAQIRPLQLCKVLVINARTTLIYNMISCNIIKYDIM